VIGKWGAQILTHISRIDARGVGTKFQATPVTDAKAVKSVVEKFQEEYGGRMLRSITQNLMWRSLWN
jgi:hypothetical protein